ncbi:hypothetical protein D3C87_1752600 [compost metagenome]
MLAERMRERCFCGFGPFFRQAEMSEKHLAVFIEDRYQRNWTVQPRLYNFDYVIKFGFVLCVE